MLKVRNALRLILVHEFLILAILLPLSIVSSTANHTIYILPSPFSFGILQESNQANGAEETGSPDVLVGLDNSRLGETLASVVQEMLEAADGVIDEGEA